MSVVLCLYNQSQTYTDTVFEHISALGKYSKHSTRFLHQDQTTECNVEVSSFDVIVLHYSIRLPYDQISVSWANALSKFSGLKVAFIQDEYDYTYRAWHWIKQLGIQLVFSVVPHHNLHRVYPAEQFPETRFVSVLTGYIPDDRDEFRVSMPPSKRSCFVGYRGRPLSLRYGRLGQEKVAIGKMVKKWCTAHNIACDIAWSEQARIYGPKWFTFIGNCRAMLGSESGCNVFDWNGDLDQRIRNYYLQNGSANEADAYRDVIEQLEEHGLMNQISPRVFEAIAMRTVLVLFEGNYSGVLEAERHYLMLKKDGSNLSNVFNKLKDNALVDELSERAYEEIINSSLYSYRSFVAHVDQEIDKALCTVSLMRRCSERPIETSNGITSLPIRAEAPRRTLAIVKIALSLWCKMPLPMRRYAKFLIRVRAKLN